MGSLKQEQRVECDQEFNKEVSKVLQEAMEQIETIDDDDQALLETPKKEANDIATAIQCLGISNQLIEIDPPPGHTMGECDFSSGLTSLIEDENLLFQEIVDECEQGDSELQEEFECIVKALEGIF